LKVSLPGLPDKPNILLILTDQERAPQHWPEGWAENHLAATRRLKARGMNFNRAFTNTSQCSPSRATLLTGLYPAQHLVTTTFGAPSPRATAAEQPQVLRPLLANLATLLGAAGYQVVYKGKWHLSRPVVYPGHEGRTWSAADVDHLRDRWGFQGWNPPDAGNSLSDASTAGAGHAANDRRYVHGDRGSRATPGFGQSALEFLRHADECQPFCLVLSLANPHDICFYPTPFRVAGFHERDFRDLPIDLPGNWQDTLAGKPSCQSIFKSRLDRASPIRTQRERREYVRFYAWLHTQADVLIGDVLDALDANGLTDRTLIIRTSDHGEMGLAHGLRQKVFTAYEEVLRVPLVVSNPLVWPHGRETDSLASLIDILPTIGRITGVPEMLLGHLAGQDLGPVLADPTAQVQDAIHYTFDDDFQEGASHIRTLREARWKYSVYFDPRTGETELELYDLEDDPLESENLAPAGRSVHLHCHPELERLDAALLQRALHAGTQPDGILWPSLAGVAPRQEIL
jgi:arylsulfatase A-like enzyme